MRAHRDEASFLAMLAEGADNPNAIATAFLKRPKDIARMHRYVTQAMLMSSRFAN